MKFLFFALLALTLLCGPCSTQDIPYQSHSFNDLNYITQQLIKGIDSFKIDINTATYESCINYSTWTGSDSECYKDQYEHRVCCLAIKGDTSSAPVFNDFFNTTSDLVALFNNQKYDFIWNKEHRIARYNRTIYLAMNIQYSYTNTTLAKHWSLTKDWLAALIQTIQSRNLDIKLILGRPAILNYYGPLCVDGSAECDENAQTIINYNFSLQGDKAVVSKPDFGVVDNFNIPFPSLQSFCSSEFPSYGDSLPYFFYEVAHEVDVQNVVNEFTGGQCHRSETHPDLSSVRITSNIDPEMLQSYFPRVNPLADIEAATNVLAEVMDQEHLFITYFDTNQNVTRIQLRSLKDSTFMKLLGESFVENDSYPILKISYRESYLYLQSEVIMRLYNVTLDPSFSIDLVYYDVQPIFASDMIVYDGAAYILWVEPFELLGVQTLVFNVVNVQTNTTIYTETLESELVIDLDATQSATLSAALDSSNNLRAALIASTMFEGVGDYRYGLYAFTISASLAAENQDQNFTVVAPTSYIDFGTDPDLKLLNNNGILFLLEAHSNGLCQCADYLNNGNVYKCGISGTTNAHIAQLQNMDYIMNYNWGRLDDFEARIQNGEYINACDSQIMHAKFSNGANPSGFVYRNETSGFLQALFVNEHVDYDDLPIATKLFCGSTMEVKEGETASLVEVNTFNLVDFYLFSYL